MFIKWIKIGLTGAILFLAGCQEDLLTETPEQESRVLSGQQGEIISDFNAQLNTGEAFNLNTRLVSHDAVVLYFTMWCVVCDSHTSLLQNHVRPNHNNVDFVLVDYVSGSLQYSRSSQQNQGHLSFDVIVDIDGAIETNFSATMGSIIVIDKNLEVKYNQYFNSTQALNQILNQVAN